MIDPSNITKYNRTVPELEEVLLFWICVAGKTAKVIAARLDKLLGKGTAAPFKTIEKIGYAHLASVLRAHGIGCYNLKAKSIWELINAKLDLRTCTTDDLEKIYGIGPKTSRCFIMHSRPNARLAGLDTHVLKFLRVAGMKVPKSTPSGNQYRRLERAFLDIADSLNISPADLDLMIWNHYARPKTV